MEHCRFIQIKSQVLDGAVSCSTRRIRSNYESAIAHRFYKIEKIIFTSHLDVFLPVYQQKYCSPQPLLLVSRRCDIYQHYEIVF